MVSWLGRLLYGSTPAEFRSAYSVPESVDLLLGATKRSAWSALDDTTAVGQVSAESVRLHRVIPMIRNSFKPFFTGRFENRDGVTVLTGCFTMPMVVKIFMSFWLGMVALFAVGLLLGSLNSTASFPLWAAIAPLFMLATGLGLVRLGKWFARNDAMWLSGIITQTLGVPVAGAAIKEPATDLTEVPVVLKAVALFLAASGVAALFMYFFVPQALRSQGLDSASGFFPLAHLQLVYAVSGAVLSVGVWRRRPWAWWGGFLLLGVSTVTSLLTMPVNMQMALPPMMQLGFGIFALIVIGMWGRWWYAQRRHFLWKQASAI